MRCYWEQIGVLGPLYRLLGAGQTDHQIANKLHLEESTVQSCNAWLIRFQNVSSRAELVLQAASVATGGAAHL
jgi:DNA-binding NarL/FixJ family response regulator